MKESVPLTVLVIGAGMYVCGRGTEGYGTVLPALYRAGCDGLVGGLRIAATSAESLIVLKDKIRGLNELLGWDQQVELYPRTGKDFKAYRQAMQHSGKPDCAIVSVPDHLHFEITADLLEQGIHCLVVKPLAPTVAEVSELIRLAELKGLYGAVEFHKRYDRSNLKLRDTIRQGLIGDPLYFIVEYSQRKNIPLEVFRSWVCHTNILQYLGIHYIDIIYFATRATPRRVMALGQMNYLAGRGVATWDSIQCITEWETKSGRRFTSAVLTNWIDPERTSAMSDQKIKVIGTKGRYEADQKRRGITVVTDDRGMEEPNPDFSAFYGTDKEEGIRFQGYGPESILQFLKDVRDIKRGMLKPGDLEGRRPTFRESLVPTVILEAANQSLAADGAWIDCKLPDNS